MDWSQIFDDNDDEEEEDDIIDADDSKWERKSFLSQYISKGTKASGGSCWWPNDDGSLYPRQNKGIGCCNDERQAWIVDNQEIGNWRALRIMNNTDNIVYIEWYVID